MCENYVHKSMYNTYFSQASVYHMLYLLDKDQYLFCMPIRISHGTQAYAYVDLKYKHNLWKY